MPGAVKQGSERDLALLAACCDCGVKSLNGASVQATPWPLLVACLIGSHGTFGKDWAGGTRIEG